MKLTFCVACGSTEDLQHHHLVIRAEGGRRRASIAKVRVRSETIALIRLHSCETRRKFGRLTGWPTLIPSEGTFDAISSCVRMFRIGAACLVSCGRVPEIKCRRPVH